MRSMLPYLVHAHRYADTKLPHDIGGADAVEDSVRAVERHFADPTVADILLAANREELSLLLKGEAWVFDELHRGLLQRHAFHDVRQLATEKGVRAVLEQFGILHAPLQMQQPEEEEPRPSGLANAA